MSAEIRHGPVTMHRAVERAIEKSLRARPADAPRTAPAAEGGEPPDANRPDAAREAAPARGGRGGRPSVRRTAARGDGGAR
jgi:hypothetical protein